MVWNPAERVTNFAHDADGNLTKITDPDTSFRQFAYEEPQQLVAIYATFPAQGMRRGKISAMKARDFASFASIYV